MNEEDKTKIKVALIFDVIGRPPEHLVASLEKLLEDIEKETGVVMTAKKIREPTVMKDAKDFYTTFAEIEVEVEDILYLAVLLFKYMPAHVEIIEPEMLVLSNSGWNEVLNELTRRLHGYDEIARMMQAENQELKKKLEEVVGKQVITPMTLKSEVQQPEKPKKKSVKKSSKRKSTKKASKKK